MTRLLLVTLVVLGLASAAAQARCSLFGWREGFRTRVATAPRVIKDRHVERGAVRDRFRGAGGCIGTVTAVRAQVAPAGCTGYTGPAMAAPAVKVVPGVMPIIPHKK